MNTPPKFSELRNWVVANCRPLTGELPVVTPHIRVFCIDGVVYGPVEEEKIPSIFRSLLSDRDATLPWLKRKNGNE